MFYLIQLNKLIKELMMKYIKKLIFSALFALCITSFSVTANAACG